ncbi:MAG: Acyl-CoA synthetase (AMP-forming)/AMP-acid ligase [Bradyrhizobium sp.]|nr:Acyl-CoA synthetase (AMP-forming)/AMP-acid ligase [Bradyrhizobium sp.]
MIRRPESGTLGLVVREWAGSDPSRPAILYQDRTLSYSELGARADEAAKALIALDVRAGDRVAILFDNHPDWVILALACSLVGAVCVPINTWFKRAELSWVLRHAGVAVLIAARQVLKTDFGSMIALLLPDLSESRGGIVRSADYPALRSVILTESAPAGIPTLDDFYRSGAGVTQRLLDERAVAVRGDAASFILYTSGSTADPKGVILNHRGVVGNGFEMGERRAIAGEDRVWLGSPLFYGLGATNALPATYSRGATLVLQGHFEAGLAIDTIERSGATVYYGTGNMTRAILDHPDWRSKRTGSLVKGNAGTMAEYKRLTLVELGITGAVPAYGLTESYGNATVGLPDDPLEAKLATNGRPLPGMEMRIVDPDSGATLPQGAVGLVLLRGHTTPGYLDNPVETAKALRPDGFFDTGDLGSFDPDGRFIFHSRLKEVLKTGGINVSPMEVEQLLAGHPDVRDAHVVGVSDAVKGDRIVAFVDASAPISEGALRDYVKELAASFKVPHHIFFRSDGQLPRLASGKVAKYKLAEEARQELGL